MTISPFQHELDGMGNEGIGKTNNLTRMLMYLGDPISKLICTLHSSREKYESKFFHMLQKVFTGLGFSLKGVFNSHTQKNEQCHWQEEAMFIKERGKTLEGECVGG